MPRTIKRRHIRDGEEAAIIAAWDGRCAYCGEATRYLGLDHVEPLSRGGDDTLDNLVACCGGCNLRKCDLLLLEWVLVQSGFWRRGRVHRSTCRLATAEEMRDLTPTQRRALPPHLRPRRTRPRARRAGEGN
jgi:hypothetical protein